MCYYIIIITSMLQLDQYRSLFLKKKYDPSFNKKRKYKNNKNKLSNDFDKLFFNLLIIISYKTPLNYNKVTERNIKFEFSHSLDNNQSFKIKNKEKELVINNLCYEENITLHTLFTLCKYFNMNMIFYNNGLYYYSINNTETEKVHVVNHKKDIYISKQENIEHIIENNYELSDLMKPIYSSSKYTLKELNELSENMKIQLNDKKYKKQELYDILKTNIEKTINL